MPVVGPFDGKLQDDGERIALQRPFVAGAAQYYATVDDVGYGARAPWPPEANGAGPSLQRINLYAPADDPRNWLSAAPTPGAFASTGPAPDSDNDGLPDGWELAADLSPFTNDAALDPDADGFTNGDEFLAGTDPHDAASVFEVSSVALAADGTLTLQFRALPGRTYTVETSEDLVDWETRETSRLCLPPA